MKKWIVWLAALLCGVGMKAFAQHSPVVMRIGGHEILSDELEYAYRNDSLCQVSGQSVEDFLPRFARLKLEAYAGEAAGLDTTAVFAAAMDDFRKQQAERAWAMEMVGEDEARRLYDRMAREGRNEAVCVEHIFKRLPQNVPGTVLRRVEAQMDSIYNLLQGGEADFGAYVQRFSDETGRFWVKKLQMPVEFEDTVWALRPGGFSRPFFTPQGIHIVKVLERRNFPSFEEMREKIALDEFRHRMHGKTGSANPLRERLQRAYRFVPDKGGMNELLRRGQTGRTLFTLAGKAYTGTDFALFATACPGRTKQQLDAFVMKCLLDCEYACLERQNAAFGLRMQLHRDSLLADAIRYKEVVEKSTADEKALHAYFKKHHTDYYWDTPRYKGIVLHCVNRRTFKRVRKLLKQLPADEWLDAIRLVFNDEERPKVQAEQGLFAPGENAFVDYFQFDGEKPGEVPGFPYAALFGRLLKGPEDYWEVRERVVADYRRYLETQWLASLRGKVEINEEVLKTVNNNRR